MLTLLLACTGSPDVSTLDHPALVLSTEVLTYDPLFIGETVSQNLTLENQGGTPLGVAAVEVVYGAEHWSVALGEADCFVDGVLEAGCVLPVEVSFTPAEAGPLVGGLKVSTETTAGDDPEVRGNVDPATDRAWVTLDGTALRDQGRVVVTPRSLDFGTVYVGEDASLTVDVENLGDGVLTLFEPVEDNCDEAFSFLPSWTFGDELGAGSAETVTVTFSPEDDEPALCSLLVATDDGDWAELEVAVQGNRTESGVNTRPSVVIDSPAPLTLVPSNKFTMQLTLSDAESPATSLQCRISSMNLLNAALEGCQADDETGVVEVEVATNGFPDGTDTIQVEVVDPRGATGVATVPLLMDIDQPADDDDGDGYGDADDCDDADATVYPWAAELEDQQDNDCDAQVDEGGDSSDDDGDTFSEEDGDCNDADASTYPGAPEAADYRDNDCDGAVDNGTPLYDDDGDGHSEALGDCDDDDADAFPNADEYCNDADDDCDGVVDDDCIALTQVPLQQTDVIASPTSVEGQGTAQVSMVVVDDGDLSWSWSADGGSFADPTAEAATWNAPAEPGVFTITGRALDADNNEVWAFGEVTVLPDGALDGILIATEGEGCSTAPVGGLWLLLLAVRRRR